MIAAERVRLKTRTRSVSLKVRIAIGGSVLAAALSPIGVPLAGASPASAASVANAAENESGFFTQIVSAGTDGSESATVNKICPNEADGSVPTSGWVTPLWKTGTESWNVPPSPLPARNSGTPVQTGGTGSGSYLIINGSTSSTNGSDDNGATATAISNAINSFSAASPVNVYVRGYIRLTGTISINKANVRLVGVSESGQLPRFSEKSGSTVYQALNATATATNFSMSNLTFAGFGNNLTKDSGAGTIVVDASAATGAKVHRNFFLENQGTALVVGSTSETKLNCFAKNGTYGMRVNFAYDVGILNNEFYMNGTAIANAGDDPRYSNSGAIKVWVSSKVYFGHNFSRENTGQGVWFDNNNSNVEIAENYVYHNQGVGVMYETSYNAYVRYNTVLSNNVYQRNVDKSRDRTQAGILIAGSGGAVLPDGGGFGTRPTGIISNELLVTNNHVKNNHYAITLLEDPSRFCGAFGESSAQWCTLTGGRNNTQVWNSSTSSNVGPLKTVTYTYGSGTQWKPIFETAGDAWRVKNENWDGTDSSAHERTCRDQEGLSSTERFVLLDACYWRVKRAAVQSNYFYRPSFTASADSGTLVYNSSAVVSLPNCQAGISGTADCYTYSDAYSLDGAGQWAAPTSLQRLSPFQDGGSADAKKSWFADRMVDSSTLTSAEGIKWDSNTNVTTSVPFGLEAGLNGSANLLSSPTITSAFTW